MKTGIRFAAAFVALLVLVGCEAVVENGNGPLGPERATIRPAYPWRVNSSDRAKTKTAATPCGPTEETECEGGTCRLKPSK